MGMRHHKICINPVPDFAVLPISKLAGEHPTCLPRVKVKVKHHHHTTTVHGHGLASTSQWNQPFLPMEVPFSKPAPIKWKLPLSPTSEPIWA